MTCKIWKGKSTKSSSGRIYPITNEGGCAAQKVLRATDITLGNRPRIIRTCGKSLCVNPEHLRLAKKRPKGQTKADYIRKWSTDNKDHLKKYKAAWYQENKERHIKNAKRRYEKLRKTDIEGLRKKGRVAGRRYYWKDPVAARARARSSALNKRYGGFADAKALLLDLEKELQSIPASKRTAYARPYE